MVKVHQICMNVPRDPQTLKHVGGYCGKLLWILAGTMYHWDKTLWLGSVARAENELDFVVAIFNPNPLPQGLPLAQSTNW